MDKIKTVKIKNPDGSISEETYTISVNAKNVDMANGKELQETIGTINIDTDGSVAEQLAKLDNDKINVTDIIDNLNSSSNTKVLSAKQGKVLGDAVAALEVENIKKKTYFFDTVADMKNANLKDGDYVCTLGYYEPNDGGNGEYRIVNGTHTDDGGSYHQLNNNLYAELIIKDDILNIKQWGAKVDSSNAVDITLNNTVFANVLLYHNNTKQYRIYIPIGVFWISQPINITTNVTEVFGSGREKSIIRCATDGIDIISIQQAGNSSIYHDFGIYSQWNITNYAIHCYNRGGARLKIENLRIQDCRKGIYLADGYNDCVIIRNVKFHLVGDCIYIKQNDNGIIEDCNAEPFTNSFLTLLQANACAVRNCLVNTSSSIFSVEDSNSTAFILTGNYNSGSTQHYGTGITIENIHSEYVKTFALIGIPYVTLRDIYIWNGSLENDKNLIHLANIANNPLHNIQMYNIITDDCPHEEGKYHLYKADYSESTIVAGNGETYNTSINNVTNLYINGFEGDAHIPTKLSDAHSATYYIRDKNVAYSNGTLILYGTGTPSMTTTASILRDGIAELKNGDRYHTANDSAEYIYSGEDQKWYGIKPMYSKLQGQVIHYAPKTYNGSITIAVAAIQHNRQALIQAIMYEGKIAAHSEITSNATVAVSSDNTTFDITFGSYMNPVSVMETCHGFYRQ